MGSNQTQTQTQTKHETVVIDGLNHIIASSMRIIYESNDAGNVAQAKVNLEKAFLLRLKVLGIEVPETL